MPKAPRTMPVTAAIEPPAGRDFASSSSPM